MSKTNALSHKKTKKLKRSPYRYRLLPIGILLIACVYFIPSLTTSLINSVDTYSQHTVLSKQPLDEIIQNLSVSKRNEPVFISLMEKANTYPEARILLANHESYPDVLLELASARPETLQFVVNYTNHQPLASSQDISIKKDYKPGMIPHFIQWDKRWGYEAYGSEFIGSSGCGPTALSMVLVGLTGDTSMHPKAISDFSYESGYFYDGVGTSWSLMSEGAHKLGLNSNELPLSASVIRSTLENGQPIILSMRPGHFTQSGHFIVLTGIASDGTIIVNDPGSIKNSQITWDLATLMNETKNLWAFSAA